MIKETKDVVVFVARFATDCSKALEDGKLSIADAVFFGPAIAAFPAALAGIGGVVAEVQSATDADKEELVDTFCAEFSVSSAVAEMMVEKTIEVIVAFWKLMT